MEVLERCDSELTTLRKRVQEWMKDEEENRETPLYNVLETLLGFIGVCLDKLDLLFVETSLWGADEDEINNLVAHVDFARDAYRQLL